MPSWGCAWPQGNVDKTVSIILQSVDMDMNADSFDSDCRRSIL